MRVKVSIQMSPTHYGLTNQHDKWLNNDLQDALGHRKRWQSSATYHKNSGQHTAASVNWVKHRIDDRSFNPLMLKWLCRFHSIPSNYIHLLPLATAVIFACQQIISQEYDTKRLTLTLIILNSKQNISISILSQANSRTSRNLKSCKLRQG